MATNFTMDVSSDLKVTLSVKNPRIITVTPVDFKYETTSSESKLIAINYTEKISFKENSTITIEKQKYKVQYITKGSSANKECYQLHTHSAITKTSNFIMPFLGFNKDYFKWEEGFVNSYIGTEEDEDYGNKLYLLYRFNSSTKFTEFENQMISHPNFNKLMDPDPYHTIYCFDLPQDYQKDINTILEGKYSQISEEAKKRLIAFHKSTKERPLYQILYKDPKRKLQMEVDLSTPSHKVKIPEDNELYSPLEKQEEIFLNKYKIEDGKNWTS
jgi:hypothetical protein